MNIPKYIYASAVTFLIAISGSPAAIGQTILCFPLPPGTTTPPPDAILPPGIVFCPAATELAPTALAAPVVAAPVVTEPTRTSTITIENGTVYEDHEGRGKKNGMDNGKKNGHDKDHHDQNAHSAKLVMAGTISGDTLTVTAISSGHLEVGTILSGEGIPQPVKIIAFGTGKGGTGTYTISTQ